MLVEVVAREVALFAVDRRGPVTRVLLTEGLAPQAVAYGAEQLLSDAERAALAAQGYGLRAG